MSRVEPVHYAEIEKQLLLSLEDGDKVAMILGKEDLSELIRSLEFSNHQCYSARTTPMLADLKKLYQVTFGGG